MLVHSGQEANSRLMTCDDVLLRYDARWSVNCLMPFAGAQARNSPTIKRSGQVSGFLREVTGCSFGKRGGVADAYPHPVRRFAARVVPHAGIGGGETGCWP